MSPRARFACAGLAAGAILLLGACGGEPSDLQGWMEQQRKRSAPLPQAPAPASEPEVAQYRGGQTIDPFDTSRIPLSGALGERGAGFIKPDAFRAESPLERHPLEAMVMVGSVQMQGRRMALIRTEEGLFKVAVGMRIGVHRGQVTQVSERELIVVEPIAESRGGASTRRSVLSLKEAMP